MLSAYRRACFTGIFTPLIEASSVFVLHLKKSLYDRFMLSAYRRPCMIGLLSVMEVHVWSVIAFFFLLSA